MDALPAGCDLFFNIMKRRESEYAFRGERVNNGSSKMNIVSAVQSGQNIRCDTEDVYASVTFSLADVSDDKSNDRTIHSGHFMVSHIHEDDLAEKDLVTMVKDDVIDDESDNDLVDCPPSAAPGPVPSASVSAVCASTIDGETDDMSSNTLSIDSTLTKLFECMTLAYSGKLRTPKWKNFKKIRVGLKDKIRLNNLIWREWHMQYKEGRAPVGCQFVTRIPEKPSSSSIVAEKMAQYWRARLQKLVSGYNKWKPFLCRKLGQFTEESESNILASVKPASSQWCLPTDDMLASNDFLMGLSDTLFSSLSTMDQSLSARDLSILGIMTADVMQPDLDPLVPMHTSLEDFMDTLEAPVIRSGYAKSTNVQSSDNWISSVVADQPMAVPDLNNHGRCIFDQQTALDNAVDDVYDNVNCNSSCDETAATVLFEAGATQDYFDGSDSLYGGCVEANEQLFEGVDGSFRLLSNILQQEEQTTVNQYQDKNQIQCSSPGQTLSQSSAPKHTLSFGSSEEVSAMLQNQLMHEGATFSCHTSEIVPQGNDIVSVAFSDDVLQQLIMMFVRDGVTSGHQIHTLPSIAETPSNAAIIPGNIVTLQPVLQVVSAESQVQTARIMSSYLKVEPGSNFYGKPAQSMDNLCQVLVENGPSGGNRRASTGSLSSSQPILAPRVPPVVVPVSNNQHCQSAAEPGPSTCSRRTILPRPPAFNQSSTDSSSPYLSSLQCGDQHSSVLSPVNVCGVLASTNAVLTSAGSTGFARTRAGSGGTLQKRAGSSCAISSDRTLLSRAGSSGSVLGAGSTSATLLGRTCSSGTVPSVGSVGNMLLARASSSGTVVEHSSQRRNSFLEHLLTQDSSSVKLPGQPSNASMRTRHKSDQSRPVGSLNCSPYPVVTIPSVSRDVRGKNAVFQPINPLAAVLNNQSHTVEGRSTDSPSAHRKSTLTKVSKVANLQQAAMMSARSTSSARFTPSPSLFLSENPSSQQLVGLPSPASDPTGLQLSMQQTIGRARHASSDAATSQLVSREPLLLPVASSSQLELRRENRRVSHISAEQRRRGNIKSGFDVLNQLIPSLSQSTNVKISKATTLLKAAEMFRRLKQERTQMVHETEQLQEQIRSLETAIRTFQSQLPASGITPNVSRQPLNLQMSHQRIENYIATRIVVNWKFWIFGNIIRSLYDSYDSYVSTASADTMCRTLLDWLKDHCSLAALRQVVTSSLRQLSMTTSILSNPSDVPNQLTQVAMDQLAAQR